ncbi:MAG: TROVE domain protein [Edafosvirus sp.]|uniref:TROVE domain protein n=1 Tax=Edafosvirus sp. TaxID=2487765 RepID=A0A3G4ZUH4_9VIRU|nr:MAG: TROVE domain protein [Edafosvirus sp.]
MTSVYQTVLTQTVNSTPSIGAVGQLAPIPGKEHLMKENYAGGYTFVVSDEERIRRILILGTHANTYYASAKELTTDTIEFVKKLIAEGKGEMILNTLLDVYMNNRAAKQDPTFVIWALLARSTDLPLRKKALASIVNIRTLSQLYTWKAYHKKAGTSKGWGRIVKKAFCDWVLKHDAKQLAYQAFKYQQRATGKESWSLRDFFRCIHMKGSKQESDKHVVIRSIVKQDIQAGLDFAKELKCTNQELIDYLSAIQTVKGLTTYTPENLAKLCELVKQYNLAREILPTWCLKYQEVWQALTLKDTKADKSETKLRVSMPYTALIRNVNKLTICGLLDVPTTSQLVADYLKNQHVIHKAHVHPVNLLLARLTYEKGKGDKGSLTWVPNADITNALTEGFYNSFKGLKATGKRILHAIDCSPSMTSPIACMPSLTSSQAAGIMTMVFSRVESLYCEEKKLPSTQEFVAFTSGPSTNVGYDTTKSLMRLVIKPTDSFEHVTSSLQLANWAGTDCALPMLYAIDEYKRTGGKSGLYDVFIVYTDNETWAGAIHPSKALQDYRKLTGIPAKMIVLATLPSATSIADPTDSGMMDIIGFDTNAPQLVSSFLADPPAPGTTATVSTPSIPETEEEDYDMI